MMYVDGKKIKCLYVATTHDEYEFPIAVADSVSELAKMLGVKNPNSLSSAIAQGRPYYYKVEV